MGVGRATRREKEQVLKCLTMACVVHKRCFVFLTCPHASCAFAGALDVLIVDFFDVFMIAVESVGVDGLSGSVKPGLYR